MAMANDQAENEEPFRVEDSEDDEEVEDWEDWGEDGDGDEVDSVFLCLFCDCKFSSSDVLFEHCRSVHHFDFHGIWKALSLDFYGSFKLINYVRSQVAENRCWSCGLTCQSNQDLHSHLHETVNMNNARMLWDDDKYLKPFMPEDSLLYSFSKDEEDEDEDDQMTSVDKEEIVRELRDIEDIHIDDNAHDGYLFGASGDNRRKEVSSVSNSQLNMASSSETVVNGFDLRVPIELSIRGEKSNHFCVSRSNLASRNMKNVNEDYFGSYSSFGIHREMISDKVRTNAYRQAILKNPSLLNNAVVMDVGCGTGILSLFAAQAGASRVIAVEASEKMAAVAIQIAKDNGLWRSETNSECHNRCTKVMEVVQGMIEELDKSIQIQPHSVDVLLSEWMGYCLLYESMLSSVLFARDQWLKPGGAILPDTATIFVAGFGRGGTSLPFWEDVYGFNMSSVGKELVRDAARTPIVDVVDGQDLVTDAAILQSFDLATMKHDEVDFTARVELEPKLGAENVTWCYGVVLWFETAFTSRFCKEMPTILSTSPYNPKTHWSQTIFTFPEPVALSLWKSNVDRSTTVGSEACPAAKIHLRVSIARAAQHRSIDISVETTGIGIDGRKHSWPVQIFNIS